MTGKSFDRYLWQAVGERLRAPAGWLLVGGAALAGLVLAGLATRSAGAALAGLLAGAFAAGTLVFQRARTEAVRRALAAWGGPRGLEVVDPAPRPERLRWVESTDGKMGPGLAGPLAGGEGGIGHYTYVTGSGDNRKEHPFTLAWTSLAGIAETTAVSLGPRELGGLLDGVVGAFSSWREVELESVEFERRFALWVADGTDEVAVRRFFSPAVIAGCLDHPPAGRLEIGGGALFLSVERHLLEPVDLDGVAGELGRWADALRAR